MLHVFAMKCCHKMPCPLPHNKLLTFFTYILASPAHLYIPHLFTHWLPTIICVMLMSIAFFFYFCYMLLFFVILFWIVCVHIFDCLFFYAISFWLFTFLLMILYYYWLVVILTMT